MTFWYYLNINMKNNHVSQIKKMILLGVGIVTVLYYFYLLFFFNARKSPEEDDKIGYSAISPPPTVSEDWSEGSQRYDFLEPDTEDETKFKIDLESNLLLPDINTRSLDQVYTEINAETGKKLLRFSSANSNIGDGPLKIINIFDPETDSTIATQRIYRLDGSFEDFEIGRFVFHNNHNHWHFENFSEYELFTFFENGDLNEKVASTGKTTFCIYDTLPLSDKIPNKASIATYVKCDSDIQGISVGWIDIYEAKVLGQEIDISELDDGFYVFRSTVNPDKRIIEKTTDNNFDLVYLEILGNSVTIIPSP